MKKKEFKRTENLLFLAIEIFHKAIELKKLQGEEMEKIRQSKINYPSGGMKEFAEAISKQTLFPIQEPEILSREKAQKMFEQLENALLSDTVANILIHEKQKSTKEMIQKAHSKIMGMVLGGKSPKEVHEEALENGLKTEKKCETASALLGSYQEKKWYKNEDGKTIQYNQKEGVGYGVNLFGTWVDQARWLKNKNSGVWVLATDEEVKEMLTLVAERLGFKKGVKYKTSSGRIEVAQFDKPDFYYDGNEKEHRFNMALRHELGIIYYNGVWSEIIK